MKTLIISLLSFLILFYTSSVSGQDSSQSNVITPKIHYYEVVVRTPPTFTLQFSLGYNYGVYELSANDNGDFSSEEFLNGKNFGVRHGIGGNVVAKIPLHKKGYLRLNISASFNYFSSKFSKANVGFIDSRQFVKYNAFSGGVGIENNFTPSLKFKTLVGISFLASIISGNAGLVLEPDKTVLTSLSIKPAFRLGVAVYSGFEYLVNNDFGLNFGFQFTHANLLLKKSEPSSNTDEIYLNDKKVSPKIPFSGFKQFAFGSFFGGVNIYFGVNKKDYIIRKY